MKKLTICLALALASSAGFAATSKNVNCFELDSANPGLKKPGVCDLDRLTYGANMGTLPTAGVTVVERGIGFVHQTVFTLTAASVTVTDATTNGAHGGIAIYDFPSASITILGATSDLAVTAGAGGIADGASALCSLGSVVVANTNATLTSTEADSMPSTAATLSGGVGACSGASTAYAMFDGTATTTDLYLNFAVPDGDSSASDTLSVTGTVTVTWTENGDN